MINSSKEGSKKISFSDFLLESASTTIKALAEHFGKSIVYIRSLEYQLNDQDLKMIFNILNQTLFDSKLDEISLSYATYEMICKRYTSVGQIPPKNIFYGEFFALVDFEYIGKIHNHLSDFGDFIKLSDIKVNFHERNIFMNSSCLVKSNFIFAVNCICHEMIHQYNQMYGETKDLIIKQDIFNVDIDEHTTPTFKMKKKQAMDQKLKIIEDGIGKNYQELNDEAYSFLVENDIPNKKYKLVKSEDGKVYIDLNSFKSFDNFKVVDSKHAIVTL